MQTYHLGPRAAFAHMQVTVQGLWVCPLHEPAGNRTRRWAPSPATSSAERGGDAQWLQTPQGHLQQRWDCSASKTQPWASFIWKVTAAGRDVCKWPQELWAPMLVWEGLPPCPPKKTQRWALINLVVTELTPKKSYNDWEDMFFTH